MKDVILTIDIETREVKHSKNFVGISGENLQNNIVVDFVDNNFVDGTAYFECEIGGEKFFYVMTKSNEYDIYSLVITADLLQTAGKMTCQIKIVNDTAVFKSKKFVLPVLEAINAENTRKTPASKLVERSITETSADYFSGITEIGQYSFSRCSNLTNIVIPNNITSIRNYAFSNCSKVASVILSENLLTIGDYAFNGCFSYLPDPYNPPSYSIVIPSTVTSIGKSAFLACTWLKEMTVLATNPPTLGNSSSISSSLVTTIYIPAGTLSAYQSATNWSNFADKFVELSE